MIRGMRAATTLFLLASLITACAALPGPSAPTTRAPQPLRLLALGDSYTYGQGVAESERYPEQLAALLRQAGRQVSAQITARSGWTSDDLLAALEQTGAPPAYDWVMVLIGANDHFSGRPAEQFQPRFNQVLARAAALAGGRPGRVLVLTLPDWSATPLGEQIASPMHIDALSRYQQVIRSSALQAGAAVVDITPLSLQVKADPALLAQDGLHYSGKMYALWAAQILPIILASSQP